MDSYGMPRDIMKKEIVEKLMSVRCIWSQAGKIIGFRSQGFDYKKELDELYGMVRAAKELLKMDFGYMVFIETVVGWLIEE